MFAWLKKRKEQQLSLHEKRLAELHPLFRVVDAGLQIYVDILRAHPTWNDDQVRDELCRRGVESGLAQDLVAFVPLAFAREIVVQIVPVLPDTFRLHNLANGSIEECPFDAELPFVWAKEVASSYRSSAHQNVFQEITGRSAELLALNKALHSAPPGLSNEDLKRAMRDARFSPPDIHLQRPK